MKTIYEQENALFEAWEKTYSPELQAEFSIDGLYWTTQDNSQEQKWRDSKRKIVFLMKDPNDTEGADFRKGWMDEQTGLGMWNDPNKKLSPFHEMIFSWLYAFSTLTADDYPKQRNPTNRDFPLALVNVKKIAGQSNVSNSLLWEYAERDRAWLKKQVRDVLQPNIVICGGGSRTILNIAQKHIYGDLHFEKINNECYYCAQEALLLIEAYHPSAIVSSEEKYDLIITSTQKFIEECKPALFR